MKRFFIILLCLSCAYPLIAQMNGRFIFKAAETAVGEILGGFGGL